MNCNQDCFECLHSVCILDVVKGVPKTGLQCPRCQCTFSELKDSRKRGGGVRRRRMCIECGHRWNTLEILAVDYRKSMGVQINA